MIEILYVPGCPNYRSAVAAAEAVARDVAPGTLIRTVEVPDADAAERLRFLGSPTIRVDGRDVEPGAEERADYVVACRVYRTDAGYSGQPDESWIRAALARA